VGRDSDQQNTRSAWLWWALASGIQFVVLAAVFAALRLTGVNDPQLALLGIGDREVLLGIGVYAVLAPGFIRLQQIVAALSEPKPSDPWTLHPAKAALMTTELVVVTFAIHTLVG
jgi:hypothetical protein